MTTARLTLYTDTFWISPWVFTCFVALHEKGLPFDTRDVSLADREQLDPAFQGRSLTGRVPALDHDGFSLAESTAIVEYLDEAFPATPRALPRGLHERARARQILGWIRTDLGALREERSSNTLFYERAEKPLSPAGEAAAQKLLHVTDRLLAEGATSLFGAFSVADADLAFALQRLLRNGHDVPAKARAFADAQWARPSVRAFVEHVRPPFVPYF